MNLNNWIDRKAMGLSLVILLLLLFYNALTQAIGAIYAGELVLLIILSVFAFIFLKKEWRDIPTLLTLIGVVLAIMFFVLQNLSAGQDKLDSLIATTRYNCGLGASLANSLQEDEQKNQSYTGTSFSRFSTDIYEANIGYLYSKFGTDDFNDLLQLILKEDIANNIMDKETNLVSSFPPQTNTSTDVLDDNLNSTIALGGSSSMLSDLGVLDRALGDDYQYCSPE